MVKEFLSKRGITFKELDISVDGFAAQELMNKTGQMAVPVTLIEGQIIIGFDRQGLENAISRQKPLFGASLADANRIAARSGLEIIPGAYVGKVKPGSVAEKLALIKGDIITKFNSQRIDSVNELESALQKLSRGARISIVYLREGKQVISEGIL
jgi:S1-C subfamily serine protease